MSLLMVMPEKNTSCKTQLNIVYSKPNIRFLLFFLLMSFQIHTGLFCPLNAHESNTGFALLCESGELELPVLKLLKLPQSGRVAILFPSA